MDVPVSKPIKLNKYIKRKIASWKTRIYRRHNTILEFIEPLGLKKSRFSQWIHGINIPPPEWYERIEKALEEMGV